MDGVAFQALSATYATLQFSDQKNAVRGEQVGHKPNSDPDVCPVRALGRVILALKAWKAPPSTPLHHQWRRPVGGTERTLGLRRYQ